jgi:hypothetical protein
MGLRLGHIVAVVGCIGVAVVCAAYASAGTIACDADTIGLDASLANGSSGALLGEARGESFFARDTLVEFLRVWRVASEDSSFLIGIHPYIVETDSLGHPAPSRIVYDGQTLVIPDGDGIHPIEFKWTFDPPLVLPHRGLYAFFLFQDPCVAYFDVLSTDQADLYSEGTMWNTGRSSCRLFPQIHLEYEPSYDVVFQIGFCRDYVTTSHGRTWGSLKLLYR